MQPIGELLDKDTIVIEEPMLKQGFTVVPNYLFSLKNLSHGARLTYVLLLKYAWQERSCFPGVDRLAGHLEVERKSVMRYTHELENHGLIRIERRGQGKTNVYHLTRWQSQPHGHADDRKNGKPDGNRLGRSRSPMNGTTEDPATGTCKGTRHGTVLLPSVPTPSKLSNSVNAFRRNGLKDPAHVNYLVEQIVEVCGDRKSIPFYRKVARRLDDGRIFQMLSEIRQDQTIRNRGAVFTTKVQALQAV
jgi:hypothetical protein